MVTPTLRVQEKVYLMAIKKPHWELLFTSYHLNCQTSGQRTFQLECFPSEKKNCQPLEQSRSLGKVFFFVRTSTCNLQGAKSINKLTLGFHALRFTFSFKFVIKKSVFENPANILIAVLRAMAPYLVRHFRFQGPFNDLEKCRNFLQHGNFCSILFRCIEAKMYAS